MLSMVWIGIIVVVVVMALWFILLYNSLVRLRNTIDNAWSQIDVQLKRRFDLIPNLVETVKGYAKHEKQVLENVTKARSALQQAQDLPGKAKADNMISDALKSLFAVSESYPDLKANQNFMQLQEELSGTETKIAYARQFYNDSVLRYHNKIQAFPTNLVASAGGFKEREYFKAPEGERKAVKVAF